LKITGEMPMKFTTGFLMKNFMIFTLIDCVDQLKEYKRGGSCSRHGRDYKCMQDLEENPEEM
jgi:hypothetical protein